MKFLLFIFLSLPLVHCFQRTEVDCGCEDRNREAVEVRASVSGTEASSVYLDILEEVDIESRDIYGVCLTGDLGRSEIIFCADSEREYREIADRNSNVSFRVTRRIQ